MSTTYGFTTICSFTVPVSGCVLWNTISILWLRIWWTRDTLPCDLCCSNYSGWEINKGEMHIHVHKRPNVKLPHTVKDIEMWIEHSHGNIGISLCLWNSDADRPHTNVLTFDRDRLSYQVLHCYQNMHNKSAVFYTGLLCSTLKRLRHRYSGEVQLTPKLWQGHQDIARYENNSCGHWLRDARQWSVYDTFKDTDADTVRKSWLRTIRVQKKHLWCIGRQSDHDFYKNHVEATPRTEVYCRNKLSIVNCKYVGREQRNIRRRDECTHESPRPNLDMYKLIHTQLLLTSDSCANAADWARRLHLYNDNVIIKEAHAERVLSDFFLQLRNGKYSLARTRLL
jgi:hypothetical protein